jgi:hypothetical protein
VTPTPTRPPPAYSVAGRGPEPGSKSVGPATGTQLKAQTAYSNSGLSTAPNDSMQFSNSVISKYIMFDQNYIKKLLIFIVLTK